MTSRVNPEYESARYELNLIDRNGRTCALRWPVRFSEPPPMDVWMDRDKFAVWSKEHSIPPVIQTEP